ncbi:Uncharacterised protein [Yersinia pseudotuberculosis]|nr:Uncharacterised protein [Yersinia pseudotuberculosis]CNI14487.1 Uncharacterised protein [Yersinia pseudotuberculosis]CNI38849.1 Uncharacterised protein [Yersinia pseudotuberculosis]CNL62877.1 Uncharacterised protein [Yersinia pseudotuberculosis]
MAWSRSERKIELSTSVLLFTRFAMSAVASSAVAINVQHHNIQRCGVGDKAVGSPSICCNYLLYHPSSGNPLGMMFAGIGAELAATIRTLI